MKWTKGFLALLLAGVLGQAGAVAQQAPNTAPPQRRDYFSPNEINVDQDCRILPDPAQAPPGKKPKPYTDGNICHLESVNSSEHIEEKIIGTQLLRNRVEIQEHEFVLWNPADQPVTFVVEHFVPKQWVVDSDPQPKQIIGQTAFFPVRVRPGEVIRLHVGLRRTTPLRAKTIHVRSGVRPGADSATLRGIS
ncbi:MAG: hypothetical protein WBE38_07330 [Terracidiphilus sp.]